MKDEEKPKSNKWIKYAPKWRKIEEKSSKTVESKNHGGLDDWFGKEKWVDVSRPKKDGKWQPCGRGDTSKGKKPVCTPVNKAKGLSEKERKNRVRQKRQKEKEPNPDKKPNVTKYTEQAGGKSNVSNCNWKIIRTAQSEYDYKTDDLLYKNLSEKGKNYVDQKHKENPITSFAELDKIVERGVVRDIGDEMFPSKSEKLRNQYLSENPDAFEIIAGMWIINRRLFNDKQYQGFVSTPILRALLKKVDPKFLAVGNTGILRINPNSPYQKLWRRVVSLMSSVSPYFEDYGADEQIDTALFDIIRDTDNPDRGFREEADNIIAEAERLHDELKIDPEAMPIL